MHSTTTSTSPQQHGGMTLSQLWAMLTPWRWSLTLVGVSVLLGAVLELVPPLLVQQIVDAHLKLGRSEGLLWIAALYLGATAAVQVMGFLTEYLTATIAQGVLRRLRVRLFAHLQTLPLSYYDRTPLGDTISRCTADVETVSTLFTTAAAGGAVASSGGGQGGTSGATVLMGVVRLGTIAAAMVALSPLLSLVAALGVVPVVLVTRYFQVRVRDAERASRQAVGLQNTHLQEMLGGVEVIRALRQRGHLYRPVPGRPPRRTGGVQSRHRVRGPLHPPDGDPVDPGHGPGALGRRGRPGHAGGPGPLAGHAHRLCPALAALCGADYEPGQRVADRPGRPGGAGAHLPGAGAAVRGARTRAARASRTPGATPPSRCGRWALATCPTAPCCVACRWRRSQGSTSSWWDGRVPGRAASYTCWADSTPRGAGRVRVSGADPAVLTDEERRRALGVVLQVVQLFRGTVFDNLTLGDGSVSREAVQRAAAIAGADAFIQALPQGYDTLLGSGLQLSAGQRQLLALTRALVWDPAVLLLDEATAAIDSASEAAFRAALQTAVLGCGRTVLTVAHRLATAQEADRVLVLEAGQIVEEGPPEELIRRGGRFAALLELEAAGWDWQTDGRASRP